jgi:DNA-3-methyladenine glycosylase II
VSANRTEFAIVPMPPFRLDLTAWALRRRPENGIDHWDGQRYCRVLAIGDQPVEVTVRQTGTMERARLHVALSAVRIKPTTKAVARALLEKMLGLRIDLTPFYELAARDRKIARLAEEFRGLKPPRFPSVFEAVANGIACQQLSLAVGILLLNRLTCEFGMVLGNEGLRAFPSPSRLSAEKIASLRKLGFNTNKSRELVELSTAICEQRLDLERLATLDNETARERLMGLNGVGRWTAEYVLLRGLGRLDMFPGDDVGARNNLSRFLGLKRSLGYDVVKRVVAHWQPYAGFLYFHLLLAKIKKAGWLPRGTAVG